MVASSFNHLEPMPVAALAVHGGLVFGAGLIGLLVQWRRRRPALAPYDHGRLARMLVSSGVVSVASAVAVALHMYGSLRVGAFAVMHLWWVDVAIVAPLLGLALVLRPGDSTTKRVRLASAAVLVACGGAGLYGRFVEPFRLQLETPVVATGQLSRSIRIGIVADLQTTHVGPHEIAAIDRLMATSPDLILIAGDVFQAPDGTFRRWLPELRALLRRLEAPLGVFAVIGNTDQPHQFQETLAGTDIVWLHDAVQTLQFDGGEIILGGVNFIIEPRARRTIEEVSRARGPGRLALLLMHDPGMLYATDSPCPLDLAIAGHTHGGQVQLPLVGAILTFSRIPRRFAAGLHFVRDTWLYVSRGIGLERGEAPPIRFLCPPEITVLTVHPDGDTARDGHVP